jgi:valyl-tRNA synthetase
VGWKEEYADNIRQQWGKIGLSVDYSRERFTLDEGLSEAVRKVFVDLYEKDIIYRGEYIINWDPQAKTALSDMEVEYQDDQGAFYHIKYPLTEGPGHVEIATTRPETMLGDTALAVHPEDERYSDLVGKTVILPLMNKEIPIVADTYVEQDFGTGIVKITPAHDPNDFEVGNRHDLPRINVMHEDGSINKNGGKYEGMDRFEARKAIVQDLQDQGYLLKTEEMVHSVGHSERTGVVVEPRLSTQWFVKMEPLATQAINNQKTENRVDFYPERFEKTYLDWMENVHDWVISRQLWWGHRIPAWYHNETEEVYVGMEEPADIENWTQDEDVLDTWFSSALWPFSTMGWPDTEASDYQRYFPTNTLVTGYDIIFFWVSRMIFQSLEFTEERPFENVLLHGLIRAEDGRKMSKSLGNGIDPMDVVEEYGADALRWFLMNGTSPGQDVRYSTEKMDAAWNFINKIWNASRYVLMNLEDFRYDDIDLTGEKTVADEWILASPNETIEQVTELFEKFEFGEAGKVLYHFVWDDYCDWYIEMSKETLAEGSEEQKQTTKSVLLHVLDQMLRLLHPIMPFVTEEIWEYLPKDDETSIMVSEYPVTNATFDNPSAVKNMNTLIDVIRSVRTIRTEAGRPLSEEISLVLKPNNIELQNFLTENKDYIKRFTNPGKLTIDTDVERLVEAKTAVIPNVEIFVPLEGLIDIEEEIERLEQEQKKWASEVKRAEGKLANENFVNKAPENIVNEEREKLATYNNRLESVKAQIEEMKNLESGE